MTKIALVVLDTLRKDVFDEHFSWLVGNRFENAYATSHWTVPSHASMFTGRLASDVGTYARSAVLDTEEPVLAEELQKKGYQTYAFSTNGHISPGFQFDRGFDIFEQNWRSKNLDTDSFPWSEHVAESDYPLPVGVADAVLAFIRSDYNKIESLHQPIQHLRRRYQLGRGFTDSGARSALSFIRSQSFQEDSFLYLNLMETHEPLLPPPEFRTVEYPKGGFRYPVANKYPIDSSNQSELDSDCIQVAYNDAAKYLSHIYKKIYEELNQFDYIITLSDHGELLGEGGVFGHSYSVPAELTHVPLVITTPDRQSARIDRVVSLQDVYSTVLEIAGSLTSTEGASTPLLENEQSVPRFTEYHGITYADRIKSLNQIGVDRRTVERLDKPLYGVAASSSCYGYEDINGLSERGECTSYNLEKLISEHAKNSPKIVRNGTELDGSVRDRLSELGYI